MALTGHLSDLSLSELIEFFCNQKKSGRLKVLYPRGPGYFYLQTGSVVDARLGILRGIDAVYYALTLPNASFRFNASAEAPGRTINQPWTQVVLEGLRRLDEGITPPNAFPEGYVAEADELGDDDVHAESDSGVQESHLHIPSFLSFMNGESPARRSPLVAGAVAAAVLVSVAAIGIPAGWYGRSKASVAESQPPPAPEASPGPPTVLPVPDSAVSNPQFSSSVATPQSTDVAAGAAKKQKDQRDRERARPRDEKANAFVGKQTPRSASQPATPGAPSDVSKSGGKKATVQVTYDESGRVTQASGSDPTALRIARQKRFPAGKAGSATITIPLN